MDIGKRIINRCNICLQPITRDYQFKLSYFEVGVKIKLFFCGSACLKEWVKNELDKTHLNTLSDERFEINRF